MRFDTDSLLATGSRIVEADGPVEPSLDLLEAALRATPLAIVALDLDGTVRLWNDVAEAVFGWRADELLGRRSPLGSATGDDAGTGPGAAPLELRRLRRDGTPIDVELWRSPWVGPDGVRLGTIELMADVSGRRALEGRVRQAEKMEAVARLAGGVAHDFTNLLTAIDGFASLLQAELPAHDRRSELVAEIRSVAGRATTLTRQLLGLGRRQALRPRLLDLNAVVVEATGMLPRVLGEGIELRTALRPDLGSVRVDPAQLEQILLNLAVNARDAMPDGGLLRISTDRVAHPGARSGSLALVPAGRYALLSVADSGAGMDAEVQARAFEPFFTTRGRAGAGLGLATVYGAVQQNGGHVWVHSEVGRGTTFEILLPLAAEDDADDDDAPARPRPRARGETILLVEDEDAVRALSRRILALKGYTVLEAADGAQALDIARSHRGAIHLLLTDMILPTLGGARVATEVRALRPGIAVVLMSGHDEPDFGEDGVPDFPTAFLGKPFTPDRLARTIRGALDRAAQSA